MSKTSIAAGPPPNPSRPGIKSAVFVALAFGAAAFAFVGPTSTVLVAMLIGGLIGIAFGNVRLSMLALLIPTVPVQACGSEVTTRYVGETVCEPGRSEACVGSAACQGAQACNEEGDGWGECECEPGGTGGSSSDSGSAGGSSGSANGGGGSGGGEPVACGAICSGECRGQCAGTCIGQCSGTCQSPAPNGSCIGHCIGTCAGQCAGDVCDGTCDGTCG